eukprot:superscaffoldBa00001362_g10236
MRGGERKAQSRSAGTTKLTEQLPREYQENGPLFSELKFYQRAAKPESMQKWMRSRKLDFLGIPVYWGSGLAEYNDLRYRFMAMDRLGSDLQKVCERNGGRLKKATVLQLGHGLVDVLEYIHENEYVHADIKAANLMLGYRDPDQVYLADYGLSYRYCPDGVHKEYKENPKKGHDGTIEYTSLDAHKGVDYCPPIPCNLVLCGSDHASSSDQTVARGGSMLAMAQGGDFSPLMEPVDRLMDNLPGSVQQLSVRGASTDEVAAFLLYVNSLGHQQQPDYQHLKYLLASGGKGKLDFSTPQGSAGESTTKVPDPPAKGKKEEGIRRSLRPKSVQTYEEDDSWDEDEDEDEEEETRPKPIAECYLRGPPIGPRAQSKQV